MSTHEVPAVEKLRALGWARRGSLAAVLPYVIRTGSSTCHLLPEQLRGDPRFVRAVARALAQLAAESGPDERLATLDLEDFPPSAFACPLLLIDTLRMLRHAGVRPPVLHDRPALRTVSAAVLCDTDAFRELHQGKHAGVIQEQKLFLLAPCAALKRALQPDAPEGMLARLLPTLSERDLCVRIDASAVFPSLAALECALLLQPRLPLVLTDTDNASVAWACVRLAAQATASALPRRPLLAATLARLCCANPQALALCAARLPDLLALLHPTAEQLRAMVRERPSLASQLPETSASAPAVCTLLVHAPEMATRLPAPILRSRWFRICLTRAAARLEMPPDVLDALQAACEGAQPSPLTAAHVARAVRARDAGVYPLVCDFHESPDVRAATSELLVEQPHLARVLQVHVTHHHAALRIAATMPPGVVARVVHPSLRADASWLGAAARVAGVTAAIFALTSFPEDASPYLHLTRARLRWRAVYTRLSVVRYWSARVQHTCARAAADGRKRPRRECCPLVAVA